MTPFEMEEQIKSLHARTTAIEHILPTLATKDDLRLSTKALGDDLRLTTAALQHEIETGFEAAKAHADRLNEVTRAQIRRVADQLAVVAGQMATKEELQQLASKEDLRQLEQTLSAQMATKGELQQLQQTLSAASKSDFQQLQQTLSGQIAALDASRKNKKR